MLNQRRKLLIACAVGLMCSAVFFHHPILLYIGDFLVIQDDLRTADVIHVIAGPDHRVDYAIKLYQLGYGKRLFFTGDWCKQVQGNHAEYNLKRALAKGVPRADISIDSGPIDSSYSEIGRLNNFITNSTKPIKSVIIVSDKYHMRRVRWAARNIFEKQINLIMAPVPFDQSPYLRNWWTDIESRHFVWNEYKKNVYYHFRYQWTSGRIRTWLAYFDRY